MNIRSTSFLIIITLFLQSFFVFTERVDNKEFKSASVEQILNQKLNNSSNNKEFLFEDLEKTEVMVSPEFPGLIFDSTDKDDQEIYDEKKKTLDINFDSVDLVEVVNKFAKIKGVNIVMPTGANSIKSKLTIKIAKRLSINEAEKLLYTLLDVAGYSLIKHFDGYRIIKNDKFISRKPMPIYIGVSPEDISNTDERICYLYYLSNIQVPNVGSEVHNELNVIFKTLLPGDSLYKYMPESNGVLIVDKSKNIKSVMKIVLELDDVEFGESLEVIKLSHSTSSVVADLFKKNILGSSNKTSRYHLGWRGKSETTYFSKNLKIISEDRTNSLILLGRQQAIDRVKDFIFKYIDVKLDSGDSILHSYRLQYLDAEPFAKTLESIVKSSSVGGTGQSRAAGTAKGPKRFFEGIIIKTDTPPPSEKGGERRYFGSNRLIIAARNDDWIRIKKLIEELDRPQPQVIIEVLIADLAVTDERTLGSHTRTPASLNLPQILSGGSMEFQAANASPAVASDTSLHVDLLNKDGFGANNLEPIKEMGKSANNIISLSDNNGNTWSILQILQTYENSKILSHPHVVATNNQEAKVEIGETRFVRSEAVTGQGGSAIAKRQEKEALLTVKITPRISGGGTVNMQVSVVFTEFVGDSSDRIDRTVITNANIESGSILALGGLIKIDTAHGMNETPLLGRIPILGWLFKKKSGKTQKNNLTVFIRPTIVPLRLRRGIDKYTRDYINVAKEYVRDGMLFDTLREPVTRWFFKTGIDAEEAIDVFTEGTLQDKDSYSLPMPKLSKKDKYKTVLSAAEGKYKKNKVLGMKDDLMDYDGFEEPVVLEKQKFIINNPVTIVKNSEKLESKNILSREDQLKNMLSSQDNPLLS